MKTLTHIGGSYCMVQNHSEHYIDARKDVRQPWATFIEVVRNGRVYLRDCVLNERAPERIAELMKQEFGGHYAH
jgi:hypothetical protein